MVEVCQFPVWAHLIGRGARMPCRPFDYLLDIACCASGYSLGPWPGARPRAAATLASQWWAWQRRRNGGLCNPCCWQCDGSYGSNSSEREGRDVRGASSTWQLSRRVRHGHIVRNCPFLTWRFLAGKKRHVKLSTITWIWSAQARKWGSLEFPL